MDNENIFQFIENDDYDNFLIALNNLKKNNDLKVLDVDGFSILNLCVQYEMPNFIQAVLDTCNTAELAQMQETKNALKIATWNQLDSIVDILVNHDNYDVNLANIGAETALQQAIYKDNFPVFEKILNKTSNPFYVTTRNDTVLDAVITKNNEQAFDLLINRDDFYGNFDNRYIEKSLYSDQVNFFKKLYPYTSYDDNALFIMATNDQKLGATSVIIEEGGFIPGRPQIVSLISMMCGKINSETDKEYMGGIFDYLSQIKINYSQYINVRGQSALMLAIQNDNEFIFEQIVSHSHTIEEEDHNNENPLFYAINKNKPSYITQLLKKKVDPNHLNSKNETPLYCAVKKNSPELVEALLAYPNKVNHITTQGETAMSIAILNRNHKILSKLLFAGADITVAPAKLIDEKSIFHINLQGDYAPLSSWHEERVIDNFIALAQLGFDLNQRNEIGDTFLLNFIKEGHIANFKVLMKCTQSHEQYDIHKNNPLMCALDKNLDDYYKIILNKFSNIDLSYRNQDGQDAYDIVLKKSNYKRVYDLVYYDKNFEKQTDSNKNNKIVLCLVGMNKLSELSEKIVPNVPDLFSIKDLENNNLLMVAARSNSLDDFKMILSVAGMSDLSHKNKNNENVIDLINKLPIEDAEIFNGYITSFLLSKKKTIKS